MVNISMKTTAPAASMALLILALSGNAEAVQVQVEGFSFSLEDVQKLQELTKTPSEVGNLSPRLRARSGSVCSDSTLPQAFQPLCDQNNDASPSLRSLARMPMNDCEICAFAACTGC
ncbi:Guanylate cyclase activator 2B [Merluccius polli]|uniref:Guanylate cyclase activator 2B n=1 Tax=Merluccius polli TaxID=89951 RepID=A0AA47MYN9_MERPO|nr:Guanylate cyclase activator 2B [Merluccius polli]